VRYLHMLVLGFVCNQAAAQFDYHTRHAAP